MRRLKAGDHIFFSIPDGVSVDYTTAAINVIRDLGLTPFVFQGISTPLEGTSASAYVEAKTDLVSCVAFGVLLPLKGSSEESRAWCREVFHSSTDVGGDLLVYQIESESGSSDHGLRLEGVNVRVVRDPSHFAQKIKGDLQLLIGGYGANS